MKKKLLTVALATVMAVSSVMPTMAAAEFANDAGQDKFQVMTSLESYTARVDSNEDGDFADEGEAGDLVKAIPEISTTTGMSVSFNVEKALTSDWDSTVVSNDWSYQQGSMICTYTTDGWKTRTDVFPADAEKSAVAQAELDGGKNPWDLFTNTTERITVSYDAVNDVVKCYLGGELYLTYSESKNPGIANFIDGMIKSANTDGLRFARNVKNVKIGFAVGYVAPITGVELSRETAKVSLEDKTATLSCAILPAYAGEEAKISWSSSNEKVATVKDGVITAVAVGEATITVTATVGEKEYTDTCDVTVVENTVKLKDITAKAEPTTILKDTVTNIQVTIDPVDTTDDTTTTYTSSDEKIAKVDSKGVVTGVAAGDATITVKVGSIEKTVKITVINPSPEASKNPSADASKTEDDATGVITAEELKKLTIKLEGMDDKLVVSPVAADSADYKVAAAAKELKDLKWVAIDLKLESGKQPANGTKITLSLMDAIKDAKYVKVFRVDGTKLVLVDHVEVKDGKFTFAPDHFSTYIFAATTEAPTANPNTGDSTSVALALAMASIAAVALVAVRARRRENA